MPCLVEGAAAGGEAGAEEGLWACRGVYARLLYDNRSARRQGIAYGNDVLATLAQQVVCLLQDTCNLANLQEQTNMFTHGSLGEGTGAPKTSPHTWSLADNIRK
mmetsp:Transcript_66300/g.205152  ORF Transcript_66300/g.205152 Transcript_66300/m.205152 type:complete len:104 (-) Transcript_66300:42-353(-)